jgi:hypothetical protein
MQVFLNTLPEDAISRHYDVVIFMSSQQARTEVKVQLLGQCKSYTF